jgi:hypothetical protein
MVQVGGNRDHAAGQSGHIRRRKSGRVCPVSELAGAVVTPALYPASGRQRTGMTTARCKCCHTTGKPAHIDRVEPLDRGTIADFAPTARICKESARRRTRTYRERLAGKNGRRD